MITLSILIPTISDRVEMFTRIYNDLKNQVEYCRTVHPSLGNVEIIVDDSKKFSDGGFSIGKKREELVKRASGKYLCFVDDDDNVAGNYLETLLRLCYKNEDICTFNSFVRLENFWMLVNMSLFWQENQQAHPGTILRRPWHICPVKSVYAKLHPFPDSNYGEDWSWFEKVLEHCRSQAKSEAIIHEYIHGKHSEANKITNDELFTKSGTGSNP